MRLLSEITEFFRQLHDRVEGTRIVVAFSGGPDSTALLWGLQQVSGDLGVEVHAVHIHQGWDGDSRRRAERASEICHDLGIAYSVRSSPIDPQSIVGQGLEAAARQLRYQELESQRQELSAAFVATGHNADDQTETLLIRLLYGTGIEGLAGIRARRAQVVRPLLDMRRQEISLALTEANLHPLQDPTNYHLDGTRNRIRHCLLPHLLESDPGIEVSLSRLSGSAVRAQRSLDKLLRHRLEMRRSLSGVTLNRLLLERLPNSLWGFALASAHRLAGISYPPSAASRKELRRQLGPGSTVGVDCGAGWRWRGLDDQLLLTRPSPSAPGFAYTVQAPGECEIPELGLRFRLRRGAVETWMFRPSSRRAGLDLPIRPGSSVVVRSRRAGDRFRPLGCPYTRRLKDVLMDRRVPRQERGRLPLLEVDSRLAWIPGVTIDDAFRIGEVKRVWIAELESI